MNNKIYKDKCDCCNTMKVCKGFNGSVLCDECIKKETEKEPRIVGDKDGQRRFDF